MLNFFNVERVMESYRYSGPGPGEVGFMTCYQHPSMPAHDRCANCGKEICAVCITHVNDKIVCRDCADVLRSQPVPVAVEPQPEAQAPAETPVKAEAPATAAVEVPKEAPVPPVSKPSEVPAPIVPSGLATVARPSPPATAVPDPGAGGRKAKEPLLSAALSLILPGAGQAYNGQIPKGLVLAAIYLGTIAIITGGMVVTALSAGRNGDPGPACCCLPLFVVPMIVLVYAIYDAYNAAEKINNNQPVREWP
jgi:hypothetical protein